MHKLRLSLLLLLLLLVVMMFLGHSHVYGVMLRARLASMCDRGHLLSNYTARLKRYCGQWMQICEVSSPCQGPILYFFSHPRALQCKPQCFVLGSIRTRLVTYELSHYHPTARGLLRDSITIPKTLSKAERKRVLEQEVRETLATGVSVSVFVEGGYSRSSLEMSDIRCFWVELAQKLQVPVQPVVLRVKTPFRSLDLRRRNQLNVFWLRERILPAHEETDALARQLRTEMQSYL